jgi:hypothetical protein
LFFSLSLVFHVLNFVGDGRLLGNGFTHFFIFQYVGLGAYYFLLALAVVYLALDSLFREATISKKYFVTLGVVGGFFLAYYSPFLADPLHAHRTPDVLDYKRLRDIVEIRETKNLPPLSSRELAETVKFASLGEDEALEIRQARVDQLLPYLEGQNYVILVFKPLYMNTIYMSVLSIGFILLFFGYQYMKDPPQGAYIDKIMFMFLVFSSLEVFHAWSFVKSLEWTISAQMVQIGQMMSLVVLIVIAGFFLLRLRFITSVKGEFYEQELATRPAGITRWRDALDDLVIERFFNRKVLAGRLFVDPRRK